MHGTNKIRIILWLFACIVAIVLLDQWIKRLVVAWIGPGAQSHRQEVLGRFVAFEYLENRGAAFGMFQQGTNILAIVSIVIVVVALVSIARFAGTEPWMAASISLIVGGAIGNAIDRIVRGYVVDYIAIGRFWKFNLADAAVTIGAVLTFILLLRYETAGRNASITQEHDA